MPIIAIRPEVNPTLDLTIMWEQRGGKKKKILKKIKIKKNDQKKAISWFHFSQQSGCLRSPLVTMYTASKQSHTDPLKHQKPCKN